jgi:hypothetical protein
VAGLTARVFLVVNFQMVDTDNNGSISQDEFKAGCGKGWIQQPDAATVNGMKGKQSPTEG